MYLFSDTIVCAFSEAAFGEIDLFPQDLSEYTCRPIIANLLLDYMYLPNHKIIGIKFT